VAVTLALAHQIQRAIDRGEIRDQAEAARRLGLTRARLTQIMDLTLLAPELQEMILLVEILKTRDAVSERTLRGVARSESWVRQRLLLQKRSATSRATCLSMKAS
jgi:predicted XRE-type DNA-binding protein